MFYSSGGKKISCHNCHKTCLQMRTKIIFGTSLTGLYIPNTFPIGGLISVWSHGFTLFQSRIPRWLQSNSKAVKTCKDKKRSSIVNEAIKTISSQFIIFFLGKVFSAQKHKSSQNQPTKQKQTNKNNKGNNFSSRKSFKRVKIVCFAFLKKLKLSW